jgi:hypothetical protein
VDCDLLLDPGLPPEVVLPSVSGVRSSLIAWVRPDQIVYRECDFKVGPLVPGSFLVPGVTPALTVITTVPFEIIKKGGVLTGLSMTKYIGLATWMVHRAGVEQGIVKYGMHLVTLRPTLCGCPGTCNCGSRGDAFEVPASTCEIVGVKVNGVPMLDASYVVVAVSDPRLTFTSNTITVAPTTSRFQATYTVVDDTGASHIRTFFAVVSPSPGLPITSERAVVWDGLAPITIPIEPRRRYALVTNAGRKYAVRLNPYEDCVESACPCGTNTGSPTSESSWPRQQNKMLPDGMNCTWSVTIKRGCPVPQAAIRAVSDLAVKLAKEDAGEPCELPDGLRTLAKSGLGAEWKDIRAEIYKGALHFGIQSVAEWFTAAEKNKVKGGTSMGFPALSRLRP